MMRTALLTLMLLAAPRVALACPICFGQSDSPLAIGMNRGILFMLGTTGFMLAAFAIFFIYLMRRAKAASDAEESVRGSEGIA